MKRLAPFPIAFALLTAGLMAGCDSQAALVANPATEGQVTTIPATRNTSLTGVVTLTIATADLTPAMQDAESLKVLFGSTAMPMSPVPAPGSGLMVVVPSTSPLDLDLEGKQRFVFILDHSMSEVVELKIS
jgi:hypothetical protein